MPGVISAFAARKNVAPPEAAAEVASRETSTELSEASINSFNIEDDSANLQDENSFAPLDGAQSRSPQKSKRIFELNHDNIRIELPKGQSVVIMGSFSIWVRSGEIGVYGASLTASVATHRVYSPCTHALPQIFAIDKADFVLTSTGDDLQSLQGSSGHPRLIWHVPGQKKKTLGRSYHILGYCFQYSEVLQKRLSILDLSSWLSVTRELTRSELQPQKPKTILVCGSRSSGKSTLTRTIINRFLTESTNGVLLLDLDTNQPELAPPGLIYLAHVREHLLGPPLSNLVTGLGRGAAEDSVGLELDGSETPTSTERNSNVASQSRILRMHYLGFSAIDLAMVSDGSFATDLLQYGELVRDEYPGCPLIVNSSGQLHTGNASVPQLYSQMDFSDIISLDSSTSSRHRRSTMAGYTDNYTFHEIRSKAFKSASPSTIRWNQLQSYFHMANSSYGRSTWDRLALLSANRNELSYSGAESDIWAVIILEQQLALEHVAQALRGSIVAIVAVSCAQSEALAYTTIERIPCGKNDLLKPQNSQCLGLAYIDTVDRERETITVFTPLSQGLFSAQAGRGRKIALVLGKQDRHWFPPSSR